MSRLQKYPQSTRIAYMVTMMRIAVQSGVDNPVKYAVHVAAHAFGKPLSWAVSHARDPEYHNAFDEE